MPQPTAGDVHVNRPLTNISIAYLQDQNEFISGRVFPNIPVQKKSDSYYVYPKDQWFRSDAKRRAPGTESAGSGYAVSTDPYSIGEPLALHKDVPDQIRANADQPFNLDAEATEFVTRQMLLKREKEWAAKYFIQSLWTGAADFTPTTKWDAANSTPIKEIRARRLAIKQKTGFNPNTLTIAEDVWTALQDNADFLDRIEITQRKVVSLDLLAGVLDLDQVLVAGAIENTANEGATATMASVFTGGAMLTYSAPRPSLMHPSAGYTFSWNGYIGAGKDGLRMSRFRIERLKVDRVEGEMAYDQKVVATDLGAFFYGCLT